MLPRRDEGKARGDRIVVNLPFWIILIALGVGAAVHWWLARRRVGDNTDPPVGSFSFTERADWPLCADCWRLGEVQFLATSDRIRAVVTVEMSESDANRRREALEILAHEIYRHTEVEAVFVEAHRGGEQPDLHLFAPDGRGWWGRRMLTTATRLGSTTSHRGD